MELTQHDTILYVLLNNPDRVFDARDFQKGQYFVGYEATARISELIKLYPTLFIVGRDGRFRTIQVDKTQTKLINEQLERIRTLIY